MCCDKRTVSFSSTIGQYALDKEAERGVSDVALLARSSW
jgi:hypothetical protein